jgi:hypothetical protein
MQDHIFDILGIGSREDSYTDLIAYAFRQSGFENARKTFLKCIRDKNLADWIIKSTPLGLAHYAFDKDIRFGELKSRFLTLVGRMTLVIFNYLAVL